MHEEGTQGRTTFAAAIDADTPVELLENIVELGKQDTKKRNIVIVRDKNGYPPLGHAAAHRSDTASIKLLAREHPGALHAALDIALVHNKKSTAVVSLLLKCLAAGRASVMFSAM